MIIGSLLFPGQVAFSPWMTREADCAWMAYEEIQVGGSATFEVDVYHKDLDDPGEGADASVTFSQVGSTDIYSARSESLKELIRFKFTVSGLPVTGNADVQSSPPTLAPLVSTEVKWVSYRLFEIQWYNKAS